MLILSRHVGLRETTEREAVVSHRDPRSAVALAVVLLPKITARDSSPRISLVP
jgi:hypothetical protein